MPLPLRSLLLLTLLAGAAGAQGTVTPAGHLATARTQATATALADGRVLVVGGRGPDALQALASCELYEPKTGRWTKAAPLSVARANHAATVLSDGRVLVTGGVTHDGTGGHNRFVALASAELYEPRADRWVKAGPLADARNGHTATLLADGRVLVVGGAREQRAHLGTVELFDPATATFSARRPLRVPRWMHGAVRLSDGSVVVLGGRSNLPTGTGGGVALDAVERFDASAGTWHDVPTLNEARQRMALVARGDAVVLLGGQTTSSSTNYVESWAPGADAWTPAPNHLSMGLAGHTATLLPGGDIVVVGGEPPNAVDTPRVQRLVQATGAWCLAGELASSRKGHTATLLADGRVLVVGGASSGVPEAAAELWAPATGPCEDPPGVTLDW